MKTIFKKSLPACLLDSTTLSEAQILTKIYIKKVFQFLYKNRRIHSDKVKRFSSLQVFLQDFWKRINENVWVSSKN